MTMARPDFSEVWTRQAQHFEIRASCGHRLAFDEHEGTITCEDAAATMWILPLVGYLGMCLGFGFLTLAIGIFPFSIQDFESSLTYL